MSDLKLRLDKARWWALRDQPFYGQLAMGLSDVIDPNVKTAATDGKSIRWNPEFAAKLTDEEVRFVLLHETLHCAHQHLWRLPPDQNGNIAGDYCINHTLAGVPGISMPEGGLVCPPEFDQLAEEEIYARLPPEPPGHGNGSDGNPCGSFTEPADAAPEPEGDPTDDSNGTGAGDESDLKDDWERRVIQAAQNASMGRGAVPADMERILDRVREQPIDWRRELADFVRDVISARNDWSRAARRHAWQSVIYPRRRVNELGLVVFARDTSGSIGSELCAEFSAHISSALAETGCRGLVLDCDSQIQQEIPLAPGEECPLTAKGGGGTSHVPIWERVKTLVEEGEHVAGIVCLTDLESSFPDDDGGCATLWLATTDLVGPFGRTVRIKS